MMKKYSILILFHALSFIIHAQNFEIVKNFPFEKPFSFFTTWDRNEGRRAGISLIGFSWDRLILRENSSMNWYVFYQGKDNNEIERFSDSAYGSFFVNSGNKNIWGTTYAGGTIRIYYRNDLIQKPSYIIKIPYDTPKSECINPETVPYLTRNYLFALTASNDIISWELLPLGITKYRGITDTKKWLEAGNREKYGFSFRQEDNRVCIGDFTLYNEAINMHAIWKSLEFYNGKFKNIGSLSGFQYIGTDGKGLSYYFAIDPPSQTWPELRSLNPFRIVIAIVDTWTRKVALRKLPLGDWNPPRSEKDEILVYCANAIHPNGDVYFIDVDDKKMVYQLKRLKNDWWPELGVDKRKIGRITDNHIALQKESSNTATNNGFNFENDFVWVLEESKKIEMVNGKAVPWVNVRKIDNREGWILSSYIYFDEQSHL